MPRDGTGAPAPLSPFAEYLDRLKLARRRRTHGERKRRAVTRQRLELAEMVLAAIVDGSDVIADGLIFEHHYETVRGVALLVTLSQGRFRDLCAIGAEIEDDEDTHDAEAVNEDDDRCDDEPSLGIWLNSEHGVAADGEECVPLPEMAEAARVRALDRAEAGKPEDGPTAIRDGRGRIAIRRPRWGGAGFELSETVQRRARERRAAR